MSERIYQAVCAGCAKSILSVGLLLTAASSVAQAQTDPGIRPGAAGAGAALAGLTNHENKFFTTGQTAFQEVQSVQGTIPGTEAGLGPRISGHENREGNAGTITRFGWKAQNKSLVIFSGEAYNVRFNLDSCSGCHAQPAIGGTSPAVNPQVRQPRATEPPTPCRSS